MNNRRIAMELVRLARELVASGGWVIVSARPGWVSGNEGHLILELENTDTGESREDEVEYQTPPKEGSIQFFDEIYIGNKPAWRGKPNPNTRATLVVKPLSRKKYKVEIKVDPATGRVSSRMTR